MAKNQKLLIQMTKKQFQALAELISKTPALQSPATVTALAQFCHEQNPLFDFNKWIAEVRKTNPNTKD